MRTAQVSCSGCSMSILLPPTTYYEDHHTTVTIVFFRGDNSRKSDTSAINILLVLSAGSQ